MNACTGPGRGLQVPGERRIKMLLHEDARYNWSIPSTAKAVSEKNFPRGSGSFRSPVDERAVFISMYHQLHCVETMGQELVSTRRSHWGHLQHCMNFLRELTLCRPDLTLEPGDFTKRDFAVERTGAVHTCRDADQLRSIAESDWRRWMTFWQDHPGLFGFIFSSFRVRFWELTTIRTQQDQASLRRKSHGWHGKARPLFDIRLIRTTIPSSSPRRTTLVYNTFVCISLTSTFLLATNALMWSLNSTTCHHRAACSRQQCAPWVCLVAALSPLMTSNARQGLTADSPPLPSTTRCSPSRSRRLNSVGAYLWL